MQGGWWWVSNKEHRTRACAATLGASGGNDVLGFILAISDQMAFLQHEARGTRHMRWRASRRPAAADAHATRSWGQVVSVPLRFGCRLLHAPPPMHRVHARIYRARSASPLFDVASAQIQNAFQLQAQLHAIGHYDCNTVELHRRTSPSRH